MGYEPVDTSGNIKRLAIKDGNGADVIDIETLPGATFADLGAGSVHHIAFAVENRAKQLEVRKALMDTGYQVTPVIDRDYFWAIYFRTPGGVLFEVATNEPGFDRDEDTAHLGEALKLPRQHAHLRAYLEKHLQPLGRLNGGREMSDAKILHRTWRCPVRRAARCSSSSTAPAATRSSSCRSAAICCRTRRSSRRAATSRNTARRASSAAPAKASTTWTTLRGRTAKMAGFVKRASRRGASRPAVIGLGYSNGANILASVVFAEPELFDAAVLMHPLIPFEPAIDGDLAGKRILITAGRRDPICPPT